MVERIKREFVAGNGNGIEAACLGLFALVLAMTADQWWSVGMWAIVAGVWLAIAAQRMVGDG